MHNRLSVGEFHYVDPKAHFPACTKFIQSRKCSQSLESTRDDYAPPEELSDEREEGGFRVASSQARAHADTIRPLPPVANARRSFASKQFRSRTRRSLRRRIRQCQDPAGLMRAERFSTNAALRNPLCFHSTFLPSSVGLSSFLFFFSFSLRSLFSSREKPARGILCCSHRTRENAP